MDHAEFKLLEKLRARARARREAAAGGAAPLSVADRCADLVAGVVGSWRFIIVQSALLIGWIIWNSTNGRAVDPYPFILLNLMLSFQAAYTAPIIMMSQNRQEDIDRARSIQDFEVNQKAEVEIELLHTKIDLLKEREIAELTKAVQSLTRLLENQQRPA